MILNYIKSESSVKPNIVDSTSSDVIVYLRKNIVENTVFNEEIGTECIMYKYDEAKLTKEEYKKYLAELSIADIQQQRADIDYIALMTGVDLDEV